MRIRNSVKCTALIGVSPGRSGSSVNGAVTVTTNDCMALRPPGSVAVTRIVEVPVPTAVSATQVPDARTVTTLGAVDHIV